MGQRPDRRTKLEVSLSDPPDTCQAFALDCWTMVDTILVTSILVHSDHHHHIPRISVTHTSFRPSRVGAGVNKR